MIVCVELFILNWSCFDFANSLVNQIPAGSLQVRTQAHVVHSIDEPFCWIPVAESVLSNRIVPRKSVMIIVEPFTKSGDCNPPVFSWLDLVIVWSITEDMGSWVYKPNSVQLSYVETEAAWKMRGWVSGIKMWTYIPKNELDAVSSSSQTGRAMHK